MNVIKIRCLMTRAGHTAHYIADMAFMDGVPHIVVDWVQTPDGEIPGLTVALDPKYLHELRDGGEAKYLYEMPIQDQRIFD